MTKNSLSVSAGLLAGGNNGDSSNPRHPYMDNGSGGIQGPVTTIASMKQALAERTKSEEADGSRQRVLLIIGPKVPTEIVDLFCAYGLSMNEVERIDWTDPRVGYFTWIDDKIQFTSGESLGTVGGKPFFLIHPNHVRETDDVITLNYFPKHDGIRIHKARIQRPFNSDEHEIPDFSMCRPPSHEALARMVARMLPPK